MMNYFVELALLTYNKTVFEFKCYVESRGTEEAYNKVIEELNDGIYHDIMIDTITGLCIRGKDIQYIMRVDCNLLQ